MTCCDAEHDKGSEDTLVCADSALKMAQDAGGNRIELIPPTHEEDAAA
jgi:GGDEF domain-containing protein